MLGLPWLRLHNPNIDWTTATISSRSTFWHTNCFHSAAPTDKITALPVSKPPDLYLVPPAYHNLAQVFSKEQVLSLPPHWPYDCGIDLLPGAPLPSSRLYNLSHPEREVMEDYVNRSKASGLICSSSSPFWAEFFFLGWKDGTLQPCIDYQGLNKIMVKNKYLLPLIDPAFLAYLSCPCFLQTGPVERLPTSLHMEGRWMEDNLWHQPWPLRICHLASATQPYSRPWSMTF